MQSLVGRPSKMPPPTWTAVSSDAVSACEHDDEPERRRGGERSTTMTERFTADLQGGVPPAPGVTRGTRRRLGACGHALTIDRARAA